LQHNQQDQSHIPPLHNHSLCPPHPDGAQAYPTHIPEISPAVHLQGIDKSLLLLVEKSLESLIVTQWADMAVSDGTIDTLMAEVVTTTAGEGGLLQELQTQRTLELIW